GIDATAIVPRICSTRTRATLDRVGEPFFTTRPGKGQGLGVFIARVLVEHMRGTMAVASMPEKGTRITIWLPQTVTG
ncbi:MAG: ATP-binding protein, partial [Myxococcota bacterium]